MNIFTKLHGSYEKLWKYIIRPPRTSYPQQELGPEIFCQEDLKIKRNSFQLTNYQGNVFYGSHFVPLQSDSYPCVIYLHGNCSNQIEGMEYVFELLKNNISLCTFDFSGCGNSEGEYISLGFHEWKDLEEVVKYLKGKQKITKIALWGRSMGAVTALRYVSTNKGISAAVYDSPFKSFESLVMDMGEQRSKIPQLMIKGALKVISKSVKQRANFDIFELNPLINDVPNIKTPGYFIVGDSDEIIPTSHTLALYKNYKSKKKSLQIVEGLHNDYRPQQCINNIVKFLKKILFKKQKNKNNQIVVNSYQQVFTHYFCYQEQIHHQICSQYLYDSPSKISCGSSSKSTNIDQFKQFQYSFSNLIEQQQIINCTSKSTISSIEQHIEQGNNQQSKPFQDGYHNLRKHINSIVSDCKQNEQKIKNHLKNQGDQIQKLSIQELQQFLW